MSEKKTDSADILLVLVLGYFIGGPICLAAIILIGHLSGVAPWPY